MRAVWISGVITLFFRFFWKPKLKRIPVLISLIPIRLLLGMSEPNRVIQIDVGQGDSTLVQSPGRTEMIDVGSARVKNSEQWLRTFARYGVTEVSGILFTHLDEDHIGGAKSLLSVMKVGCIEINSTHLESVKGKKEAAWLIEHFQRTPILPEGCIQSMKVEWFQSTRSSAKGNEIMAGVFREVGLGSGYFALGDGDQEQEMLYEKRFQKEISSHSKRIWKVGHHGSRFSSDPGFLSRLHASEYWISVGARNRYHHPANDTLLRLQASCPPETCKIKRTDQLGDLVSNSVW
jgi:competence protein ComEC